MDTLVMSCGVGIQMSVLCMVSKNTIRKSNE